MTFSKFGDIEEIAEFIAEAIKTQTESGQRVLWLVPGGSSIKIAAAASQLLQDQPLQNLVITLTDERYGEVDHPDSNWRQLEEAGFYLPHSILHPVLNGQVMDDTVASYNKLLEGELEKADYKLGFFGIGADGHTAGILPDSPPVTAVGCAAGYDAGNFLRITMTPSAVAKLDEAVVYAVGKEKWPVLEQMETDIPVIKQPAQILKEVPKLTIFNDFKGEGL